MGQHRRRGYGAKTKQRKVPVAGQRREGRGVASVLIASWKIPPPSLFSDLEIICASRPVVG